MRIRGFSHLVTEHLEPHLLNDLHTVVIDGHNLFYPMYSISKLQFVLGPECDRFAKYVRNYLEMFKRSNVKCLFLIKGGHEDEEKLDIHYMINNRILGKDFILGEDYAGKIIKPCLLKDIFLQVLNEMDFEYAITYKNDIVEECVALANKLSCPVISFNVKYCFTSVLYIPLEPGTRFKFDEDDNMKCGIFTREKFLEYYNLTVEKLSLFVMMTDSHILDETTFHDFFKANRIPLSVKRRYKSLLQWLSRKSYDESLEEISEFLSSRNSLRRKFEEERRILLKKITRTESNSTAIQYFFDKTKVQIGEMDPLWFEKGICLRYVDITYINVYTFRIVKDSNLIEDNEEDSSVLLSIDVIKYAYDLLTNFSGAEIYVQKRGDDSNQIRASSIKYENSIQKPNYTAESCVFENGWDNIKSLKLFEHFLIETFQSFNFDILERVPADSRMLLISLVYFTRKKTVDVKSEIYSVILSYVMLAVVAEKANINDIENDSNFKDQPILDSTTDKDSVTELDCQIASSIMREYFDISDYELHNIFNRKNLHPLVEFQRCLQELNNLNILCGSPFKPTMYAKIYSATFVYKVLCDIKDSDGMQFITDKLGPAPTVLAFVAGIIEVYENILYEY